jgi:hypothetical protein
MGRVWKLPPTLVEAGFDSPRSVQRWNVMFRRYGPLEPWFDKIWWPGEPELVKCQIRQTFPKGFSPCTRASLQTYS